jgi:pilus assembly protein CpaF
MVLSGAALPVEVIRKQICSAIEVMIHLQRLRDRSRRVTEISEIIGMEGGEVKLNRLFEFVERGDDKEGRVMGELQPTGNLLVGQQKLAMFGLA